MSRSALVSTSTDHMLASQYLRVTLKSLTPIKKKKKEKIEEKKTKEREEERKKE